VRTARAIVDGGPWDGYVIRRARLEGPCQYGHCARSITQGELYIEGDLDPYEAGGFARHRWCVKHLEGGKILHRDDHA